DDSFRVTTVAADLPQAAQALALGARPDVADIIRAWDDRVSPAYTSMLEGYHYLDIADRFGDVENIKKRTLMKYDPIRAASEAGDADRPVEVPYMFCSDGDVGFQNSCNRWDHGADPYEQAYLLANKYRNYYVFYNFARDSLTWSPFNMVNSTYSRTLAYLNQIYQGLFFSSSFNNQAFFYRYMAAHVGLNLTAEILTMPNYGDYVYNDEGVLEQCGWEVDCANIDPDVEILQGEGRYPYTRYDYESGYDYDFYPTEAGHFYDYLAAILAMTTTAATVRGVDVRTDGQTYSVPYTIIFKEQVEELFNSLWLRDTSDNGPRIITAGSDAGRIVPRPLATIEFSQGEHRNPETGQIVTSQIDPFPSTMQGNSAPIRPYVAYGNRFYALLYGMVSFGSNNDLSFADNNKIFRVGAGEDITPADGFSVITCADPIGGITYGAVANDNTFVPKTAAQIMVERCNVWKEVYENPRSLLNGERDTAIRELEDIVGDMNIMRSFYQDFGRL
ncbi:MAG: hypothetical protein AAFX99_23295, partial [Myxococcota bacterium]